MEQQELSDISEDEVFAIEEDLRDKIMILLDCSRILNSIITIKAPTLMRLWTVNISNTRGFSSSP